MLNLGEHAFVIISVYAIALVTLMALITQTYLYSKKVRKKLEQYINEKN